MRDERGFRRVVYVTRPFDCITRGCEWGKETCQPGSGGSHGRGGMRLYVAVEKDNFGLSLYWHLPVYHDETPPMPERDPFLGRGLGGVDYHDPNPPSWDDDGWVKERDCDILEGGRCYSDGSSLRAGELWDEWMAKRQPDSDIYDLLEDEWEKWYEDR